MRRRKPTGSEPLPMRDPGITTEEDWPPGIANALDELEQSLRRALDALSEAKDDHERE